MAQNTWHEISITENPPERAAFGMTFDQQRGKAVLFGGFNSSGALDDTWEFLGFSWSQVSTSSSPLARYNHSFTYSSRENGSVLIGGTSPEGTYSDVWKLSGDQWSPLPTINDPDTGFPIKRHSHAAAYNTRNNSLLVYGGLGDEGKHLDDAWMYQNGLWFIAPKGPGPLYGHAIAYHAGLRKFVMFGGADEYNRRQQKTWLFDGFEWEEISTADSPSPRIYHKMAYDPSNNCVVLFGGFEKSKRLSDLWKFDGANWIRITPNQDPPARSGHEFIFDESSQCLRCFGGIDSSNHYLDDNWLLYQRRIAFDKNQYVGIYDKGIVQVSDFAANIDLFTSETITVHISSTDDPAGFDMQLLETDVSTGVFENQGEENYLHFSRQGSDPLTNTIHVSGGAIIRADYKGAQASSTIFATALWNGSDNVIQFDKTFYVGTHDRGDVTVIDPDANRDPLAADSLQITLSSDSDQTGIQLTLVEEGINSGIFHLPKKQYISFNPDASDSTKRQIKVSDGDELRASYLTPDNYVSTIWTRTPVEVKFDQEVYQGKEVRATCIIVDTDRNMDPAVQESFWLELPFSTTTAPSVFGVQFTETDVNTGIFESFTIGFSTFGTSWGNKNAHVTDGDMISFTYKKDLREPMTAYATWIEDEGVVPTSERPFLYFVMAPEKDKVTSGTEVTFHFTACGPALSGQLPKDVEYQTKLEGYDTGWGDWIQSTQRDYQYLPAGEYTFYVRARNFVPGRTPNEMMYAVPIKRHFYVESLNNYPLLPPKLTVTPGNTSVQLDWTHDKMDNILGYHVYRREEGQDAVRIPTVPDPLFPETDTFTDFISQNTYTRYQYHIVAIDNGGEMKISNKVWSARALNGGGRDTLSFTKAFFKLGNSLNNFQIEISNSDHTQNINYTLYTENPALTIEPASGSVIGETRIVNITLDRTGYGPGKYQIPIKIRSNAADYFPTEVNQNNQLIVEFSIPGDFREASHTWWKWESCPGEVSKVFVDLSPLGLDCLGVAPEPFAVPFVTSQCPELYVDLRRQRDGGGMPNNCPSLGQWRAYLSKDMKDYRSSGAFNAQLEAGEEVSMDISFTNIGGIEARSLTIVPYSPDENIVITGPAKIELNNVGGGVTTKRPVTFYINEDLPTFDGWYSFTLYCLLVDTDGYQFMVPVKLWAYTNRTYSMETLEVNRLEVIDYGIDDDNEGGSSGNGNGLIEPGETIEMPVTIFNPTPVEFPDVVLVLDEYTTPNRVNILRSQVICPGPISPGSTKTPDTDFEFVVPDEYAGEEIVFRMRMYFIDATTIDPVAPPSDQVLVYLGYSLPDPDYDPESGDKPAMMPVFGIPYSYKLVDIFTVNSISIKEGEASFEEGSGDWNFISDELYFDPPVASEGKNDISLRATTNTNCYGYWEGPNDMVKIIRKNLYRARFTLRSDQDDPSKCPAIRLRAFDNLWQQIDALHITSDVNGGGSASSYFAPGKQSRDYDLYFFPNQLRAMSLGFAFDLINMSPDDAADGTVYLESLVVERRPVEYLPNPILAQHYDFATDTQGWKFYTVPEVFTPAEGSYKYGNLWVKGVDATTFGFWSNAEYDIVLGEDKYLYCTEFTCRRDFDTPINRVPRLRFRLNAIDRQSGVSHIIDSNLTGDVSPGIANTTYPVFYLSPTDIAGNPVPDNALRLSMDFINIQDTVPEPDRDRAETIIKMDKVNVYIFPYDMMP